MNCNGSRAVSWRSSDHTFCRGLRGAIVLCTLVCVLVVVTSCGLFREPSLPEQQAMIVEGNIQLKALTTPAFLSTWGPPDYEDRQYTQFYPVENGNWVPQFRVPLGELPPGWKVSIVSKEGHFLGYADRGELLGFVDYLLVYREQLSPEEIHEVGRSWKKRTGFQETLQRGAHTD